MEEKLQPGFFSLQVRGQQITQINILAGVDLKDKFHRNRGNAGFQQQTVDQPRLKRKLEACSPWRREMIAPRELAVLAVSEMAGNAGAVKVGTNDGTITEEVETGLPADG